MKKEYAHIHDEILMEYANFRYLNKILLPLIKEQKDSRSGEKVVEVNWEPIINSYGEYSSGEQVLLSWAWGLFTDGFKDLPEGWRNPLDDMGVLDSIAKEFVVQTLLKKNGLKVKVTKFYEIF